MSGYNVAVVLHVVVAVLGTGQIGAVAILSSSGRRAGVPLTQLAGGLETLLRYLRGSLGLLVLTGVWMDVAAHGAYHQLWWVRVSFLLVVVTFALQRRALSTLKRGLLAGGEPAATLRGLERVAWSMCACIGLITVLMRFKSF